MGRVVVTGGAGFLGSHLCEHLVARGDEVVAIDNLVTGRVDNVRSLREGPGFELRVEDVTAPFFVSGPVDAVAHLASPASPPDYLARPVETLMAGSHGTLHALQLASQKGARFVLASTSEIYGDPHEHPQVESYWGNVNPIGPRSVYDEAKRYAEALTMAYRRDRGANTGIVRIFNTYGPRMRPDDGRVVSSFIVQALRGEPLTVQGDGSQTRSFCYVDDLIRGIVALLDSDEHDPVNLGNPEELTVAELAELVADVVGGGAGVVHLPLPVDDPTRRRPDIARARRVFDWEPRMPLREGVTRTAAYFRAQAVRA